MRLMGGWTLRFFSRCLVTCGFAVVLLNLAACLPERKIETPRAPAPKPVLSIPVKLEGRDLSSQELIDFFFAKNQGLNACERLAALPRASLNEARFRILESAKVSGGEGVDSTGKLKKKNCTVVCSNPLNWGSARCRLCKEEPVDLVDVWGRVGIGSHPVYEIALQNVKLPSRDEFMKLVSKEREKFGLVLLPFFETYRALMKLGVKDAVSVRNKIVQERVGDAFPGAFDIKGNPSKMEESLTLALILNALPGYSTLLILPTDTPAQKRQKLATMAEIEKVLSKPLPYFKTSSWSDFSDDAILSLNASIKSLQTNNPVQQACAMSLLHRNFAQMIRIIGYARLPTVINTQTETTSLEVPFKDLLSTESGVSLAVCPAPGSFSVQGRRTILGEEKLSSYDSSIQKIEMSGSIEPLARCTRSEARAYSEETLSNLAFGKPSKEARVQDHLAMMRVLTHQLTAFNPSSNWWAKSEVGYPLGEFQDFETIERSGSILPYQYHALALGLLQVSLDSILTDHLVQIDASFKNTEIAKDVVGIRMSTNAFSKSSKNKKIETTVDSALALVEVAFKTGAYLSQLPRWKNAQDDFVKNQYAKLQTESERANFKKMNENFINGLFGGYDNLSMLVGEKPLLNGMNIQEQVTQLKVASAMLLASFAVRADGLPDAPFDKQKFSCSSSLVTDLNLGTEVKVGKCSSSQERAWKRAFSWLSNLYKSPLFAAYAK